MELPSSPHREIILENFRQIDKAIQNLLDWNAPVVDVSYYMESPEGMQKLVASCMLLQAIGEGIKLIDRHSQGQLLIERPEIPWKQVMGMRDHISHGYFQIDAELVCNTISNDLGPLQIAVRWFIEQLS